MKNECKKIAYIVDTFPCRSETFISREIKSLRDLSFDISVLAANKHEEEHQCGDIITLYKTSFFSYQVILSFIYCVIKYPLAFVRLLMLAAKLAFVCPREALLVLSNLHTTSLFIRFLDKEEISCIHAHFLSWPSIIGLSISIAAKRNFSISAHARDIFVEQGAVELKASHAKFISTCTKDGLNHLKNSISKKYHNKLHLNYHAIKYNEIPYKFKDINSSDPKNTIIAVGRFVPKKGFENLIKAFVLVLDHVPNCELIIVGEGPEKISLENLIKQFTLENNVRLTGWQKNDETQKMINKSTVLVVPSIVSHDGDRDGIPNVVLEAFACGTPVIASKLNSINEVIEHKKNGLLTEPGNVTELASRIKDLLNNSNLQKDLAQEAYKTLLERFDPVKNTMQMARLFQNVN